MLDNEIAYNLTKSTNLELTEAQENKLNTYDKLSEKFSLHPIKFGTKHPLEMGWTRFCLEKCDYKREDFIEMMPNGTTEVLNAGIATGPANGIIVLDIDSKKGFEDYCANNEIELPLPDTFTVASGGKSVHLYFQYPTDGKVYGTEHVEGKFDVLGIGGQVIAPGSIHYTTGRPYTILKDLHIAEAPNWMLGLAHKEGNNKKDQKNPKKTEPDFEQRNSNLINEGQRNVTLTKLAGKMHAAGLSYDAISAALEKENANRCVPPLDDREVQGIVNSVTKYPSGKSVSPFLCTDSGNAERLISRFGSDLRYCPAQKRWYVWKDTRWEQRNSNSVIELAKKTIRELYFEAIKLQDPEEKKRLVSHALRSESNPGLKAMIELAQADPSIWVSPDQFDADPFALNATNGTIDLKTGLLNPHRREDLFRMTIPVAFDPHANCPEFKKFIYTIMDFNAQMVDYLQKVIGYSITGDISEQCYFILYGSGSNGKTTLLNTIRALMGPFAKSIGFNSLTYSGDQARSDLARLVGTRIVTCAEINHQKAVNESVINRITGGDPINVRFMYADEFEYYPLYKLWIAGNEKPQIDGVNYGTWRRIRLIPFSVRFDEKNRINDLEKRLLQELPGILNWAVEGCLKWQKEGLEAPAQVKQATTTYETESNVFQLFLDQACTIDPKEETVTSQLYGRFVQWCNLEGHTPLAKKAFRVRMEEKGFKKQRKRGQEWWKGIGECKDSDSTALEDLPPEPYVNLL